MKRRALLWRLAISVGVTIVLLTGLANTITNPVAMDTLKYSAEFTDVSGLHLDADARVRGVRVGKVGSIELARRHGQNIAVVDFTLDKRYGIVSTTRLAVKFQALTGVRYLDVVKPAERYSTADLVTNVPAAMTQPSFDITALFNGLQPVIATLSPEDLNTFTENVANFLSGDGDGLAPVLGSIRKLTRLLSDRQQVVTTLMTNLADVAKGIDGQSGNLIQIIKYFRRPITSALTVLDEFRKSHLYGPDFTDPVLRLLNNAGFRPGVNVDEALDRAFSNLDNFFDAFKLVPVMWENVPSPEQDGAPQPCSRGRAQLPETMDVLLNGRRVVLCNR
jgi:phospholipid/cholesterol/gamma-HCH transport system substrate-binding protein